MKKVCWGCIINIGSEVVEFGNVDFSVYVVVKGVMLGFMCVWVIEFGFW